MKRTFSILLVVALAVFVAGSQTLVEAQKPKGPTATFAAVLADDGRCGFVLVAGWQRANVDQVFGMWHLDGAFLFTTEAPGADPNAGVLIGRQLAVFQTGPFATTSDSHTYQVLTQFYSGGAFVAQEWSNAVAVPCGIAQ